MKFIGITGGVGAGKTEILKYLAGREDTKVMLADDIARELSEPGQSCNEKLQELFAGTDVFDEKGKMNRPKAAAIIFKDEARRNGMNEILHPAVKEYVLHVLEQEKEEGRLRYLVLEAALLIEEHYDEICDELWYIYTSEKNRRERLKLNRGYSDEKIDNIFASQLSESTYREVCREEIDNNHLPEDAFSQIDALMKARQVEKVQKRQTTEE